MHMCRRHRECGGWQNLTGKDVSTAVLRRHWDFDGDATAFMPRMAADHERRMVEPCELPAISCDLDEGLIVRKFDASARESQYDQLIDIINYAFYLLSTTVSQ